MPWIVQNLWLIPALPIGVAGVIAVTKQPFRKTASLLAIGAMALAFLLSLCAFAHTLKAGGSGEAVREVFNFSWFQFADGDPGVLKLGWVLDPLTAVMLVMVSFVGLVIFFYSTGYMAHDENYTRFFCFLSLFAGAMLGVVIANSLLLLFICWELVGLTSYLLIGFWYHKPSAAAAAKKAFITTRIGDVALLLGMVWLYHASGTLLFYDDGAGCLERGALAGMVARTTSVGMAVSTAIGLLIFAGAVGKSGQVPLHVWLPDAMEGPTPVSALIHAATMVAAGVFLVARVYPLMVGVPEHHPLVVAVGKGFDPSTCQQVITWIGAITAVFAASIAVAQNDIKRILAYSTVSQLGYMMMGLGVGGVVVGMFHLITHAFFKALLFLGAGSVIHGCHDEQDIRRMGGLRRFMPVTFATYAVGMLALAGFPLLFSGFWSKDEILHAAAGWPVSRLPFYLGLFGALLTAFYMTRQVALVFSGSCRGSRRREDHHGFPISDFRFPIEKMEDLHESPPSMTWPLIALAVCTIGLSAIGTPVWPWFQSYMGSHAGTELRFNGRGFDVGMVFLMLISTLFVVTGLGLAWLLYGRKPIPGPEAPDVLEKLPAGVYTWLQRKYGIDELYEMTVIRFNAWAARVCAFLDDWILGGAAMFMSWLAVGLSWLSHAFDKFVINPSFDQGCQRVRSGGWLLSRLQNGQVHRYLRIVGVALVALALLLIWRGGK